MAVNLRMERFAEEAKKYKEEVYISGYSGGGETLPPLAVSERPELYTAALHVSSQWGGFSENIK